MTLPANSTNSISLYVDRLDTAGDLRIPRPRLRRAGLPIWSNTVTGRPNAFQLHVFYSATATVTDNPAGIDCGFMRLDCTEYYTVNTVVGLVPFPMVNPTTHDEFEFHHWEGAYGPDRDIRAPSR